jgi:hypothetical protein
LLIRHDTHPSILDFTLDFTDATSPVEPIAKRPKLSSSKPANSIAQKLAISAYHQKHHLLQDIQRVTEELLKPIEEKNSQSRSGSLVHQSNLSDEDRKFWASVLAFKKVVHRLIGDDVMDEPAAKVEEATEDKEINGAEEDAEEIVIRAEDSDDSETFNAGRNVLTIFANTQGAPKQLFSSFQNSEVVSVDLQTDRNELDNTVEVLMPLTESNLPNFIAITKVPTALGDDAKAKAKAPTFGDRFAPPKNIPSIQPPKPSTKLTTKASNVTWISYEALARQRTEQRNYSDRLYNWCSTRMVSGAWLSYDGLDLPKEPTSPEERRRQRDRALSTGAPQQAQSEETRLVEEKARNDALFRATFSSFAPSRDNSGALVSDVVKSDLWWSKVGHQRAQRVFASTNGVSKDVQSETDAEAEDKMFKEAVENIDPALLEPELESSKHEADKDIDDILQDISELIETLYSYQKIRNSTLVSNSTPMTPVGQRNSLTEMTGTPSTPSTHENELYNMLKSQLALLVLQLPPSALCRLNGDKLEKLNIKTDIIVKAPDEAGTLEDDTPKQPPASHVAHGQQTSSRGPVSGPYNPVANQYNRSHTQHTPTALGVRPNAYFANQQNQRTPSVSYPRQSSGAQAYGGGYPSTGPRPGYPQAGYNSASFGQSPSRMNYSQPSQYYQQVQQAAGKPNYGAYPSGNSQVPRYGPQTPISYTRPSTGMQYGHTNAPSVQSPAFPQATPTATTPQFNRNASTASRPTYFQGQASTASGPTGFHTSMTAQEQQVLMDRQRAQIAAQTQSRLAAIGQTAANMPGAATASSYTTPSREGSGTPRPATAASGEQTINVEATGMT